MPYLVRPDGEIEYANARTRQVLGYEPHELAGVPLEVLLPVRMRSQHVQHFQAYCANPVFRPMQAISGLFALKKDGSQLPVEISLGTIEVQHGVLAVASIRDMTLAGSRKTD